MHRLPVWVSRIRLLGVFAETWGCWVRRPRVGRATRHSPGRSVPGCRPEHAPRRLGWARHSPGQPSVAHAARQQALQPCPPPPVLWATLLLSPTAPHPRRAAVGVGGQRTVQGVGDSSTAKSHSGLEEGPRPPLRLPGCPTPSGEPPCAARMAEATPFHLPLERRHWAEPGACALPGVELQQLRKTAGPHAGSRARLSPTYPAPGVGEVRGCPTARLAPRCPAPAAAAPSPVRGRLRSGLCRILAPNGSPAKLGGPGGPGRMALHTRKWLLATFGPQTTERRGLPI